VIGLDIFTRYVFNFPSRSPTRSRLHAVMMTFVSLSDARQHAFHQVEWCRHGSPALARVLGGHFDVLAFGLAACCVHFAGSSSRRIASASALRRFSDAASAAAPRDGNRRRGTVFSIVRTFLAHVRRLRMLSRT